MADNVSDFLLKRLRDWGVETIYGYPGDGINGIMGALGRADNNPRFIQYVHVVMAPEQLPSLVDRALRIATVERTVTCLIFPTDVSAILKGDPDSGDIIRKSFKGKIKEFTTG